MTTAAPLLQDESLGWGVLSLAGPSNEAPFDIDAMAEGTHFGNPVPIVEAIRSLATEWALSETIGWEPREVPIRLRISANDGDSLAQAEATLSQQCLLAMPPPLVWTSPIGLSEPSVFDVDAARIEADTSDGWDLMEKHSGHRYFLLTLSCLPFVRAMDTTIVPALPAPPIDPGTPPTTTGIDDCSTLTPVGTYAGSWSAEASALLGGPEATTLNGDTLIEVVGGIGSASGYLRLVRHFSTPLAVPTGEYLAIDARIFSSGGLPPGSWRIHDGTTYHDPVAVASGGGEGGSDRLYFGDLAASISDLKILFDFATSAGVVWLYAYDVAVTNYVGDPTTSTTRQRSRQLQVAGTAPTQAALRLYDSTLRPLGDDILVYTSTNTAWQPPLRHWLQPGPVVTAALTRVSGGFHTLSVPSVYRIPARLFTPGPYALLARLRATGEETLTWSAKIVDTTGADTIGSTQAQSGEVLIPDSGGSYHVTRLGWVMLPPVEVETDDYMVQITLSGSLAIELDEAWLFALNDGALTWIRPNGVELNWVEIRSPELGSARPSVWGGTGEVGEKSACIDWMCSGSFGSHQFAPGPMQVQTVTDDSWKSECEMEYFRRFLFHVWAGQEEAS